MADKPFQPYVPASQSMPELTIKAVVLGAVMAIVLGAANAYVGMKAGLTVAATFPAAVVAMAALRIFRGTILEENLARTTASVGEALVAGAIFTIPAFLISGAWENLRYWESTAIMFIGGVLGVLFVIVLRRTLVVEADLPFPESVAAAEIVKAGQGGQTGAKYLFGAMGLAALWELFKNSEGIHLIRDTTSGIYRFGESQIELIGQRIGFTGGLRGETPAASPMLMGVGFIVGPKVAAILFSGAVIGWMVLVPLAVFLNPTLQASAAQGGLDNLFIDVWLRQIRPMAVGTMIVAAFYTLWNLRKPLVSGIGKALSGIRVGGEGATVERTDVDLDFKKVFLAIGVMSVACFFLYWHFADSVGGALLLTAVLIVLGFLFSAVAGYLVGLIGSSNNPISGLTLSALLISAVLMVLIGVTDTHGVAAVLGVAGVVCCAAGIAGDMMQDLKVGQILGGTPWKMQVGELIGVVVASLVLAFALMLMHKTYVIGSVNLPAPQAGLMAMMSQGIVGGDMAWPLVIVGMLFALGLILVGAPSPMLIAVGMYLPFNSTSAIFVGGAMKWAFDKMLDRRKATTEERTRAENTGILVSSGFIAGESLMAVTIALLFAGASLLQERGIDWLMNLREAMSPSWNPWFLLSLLVYPVAAYMLVVLPISKMRGNDG